MDTWLLNFFQLNNLTFAHPFWLWGIFLWPALWLLNTLITAKTKTPYDDLTQQSNASQLIVKHALIHKIQWHVAQQTEETPQTSFLKIALTLLRGIILISLAITLAQPEKIQISPPLTQQKTVRDIVFVIESSASLLLPDYQIKGQPESRMNVVKSVLDQFVSELTGNRFGLIIYADNAYTLMPLTSDQTATRLNLKRLKPYLAGRLDTAMGEALGLALKQTDARLQRNHPNDSQPLKRILVLISDGLSKPSRLPITEAINYAQTINVPIYTIGIGSSHNRSDQRQYTGLLYQPLESHSLKQIATNTHAQYFQVGGREDLNTVLQKINNAEGVPFEAPFKTPQHRSLYQWPLQIGLIALGVYLLLRTRFAYNKQKKTNLHESPNKKPL